MKGYEFKAGRTQFINEEDLNQGYRTNRSKKQFQSKDSSLFVLKKRSNNETVSHDRQHFQMLNSINMSASIHPLQLQYRDECYKQMEMSLQSQNANLKEHNNFLVMQVKGMFEREKKYKKMMTSTNDKLRKLQNLNHHLQKQIRILSSNTLMEIDRMQKMIARDQSLFEEELRISQHEDHKNSSVLGWETQCSLNQNLQYLKKQVCDFFNDQAALDLDEVNSIQNPESKLKSSKKNVTILTNSGNKMADNIRNNSNSRVYQKIHQLSPIDSLQKLKSLGWKKIQNKNRKHD